MNDIYCVTKGRGGQIYEFIALKWEGKSQVKIRVMDCLTRQALERKMLAPAQWQKQGVPWSKKFLKKHF